MNLKHTRKDVLDAGEKVLRQQGYGETSLADIIAGSGIPKGSFYNYFTSKDSFLLEVMDQYSQRMNRFIQNYLEDKRYTPLNRIENFYRSLIDINDAELYSKGCLVNNMMSEVAGRSDEVAQRSLGLYKEWIDQITACITQGQEQNEITQDINARDLAHYLHGGFFGALSLMKSFRSDYPLNNWFSLTLRQIKA
jgi:TetR/AcrR family transcriptional repressor of nem operon